MKLSEAVESFRISMVGVKADSTIKWYLTKLNSLIAFLQDPDISQVELFDLERFRASLNRPSKAKGRKGKISVYTIHANVRAIKRFFNFCRKRKFITISPAKE